MRPRCQPGKNVGAINGEEADCAKKIDDHRDVKRWIRNLDNESAGAFHLPLSRGRFFPDFICELVDAQVEIVEYKGELLADKGSELHKQAVGEL